MRSFLTWAACVLVVCGCRSSVRPAAEEIRPLPVPPDAAQKVAPSKPVVLPTLPRVSAKREREFKARADRMVFTPDGASLLAGWHGTLTLWSTSGKKRRSFGSVPGTAFSEGSGSFTYSPDSRLLATGGRRIQIRDGVTGRVIRTLYNPEEEEGDLRVAFSPDGRLLAGEADWYVFNQIRVWRLPRGKLLRDLKPGSDFPSGLRLPAFSPDGRYLAAAHQEIHPGEPQSTYLSVRLYDTRTWRVKRTLLGESSRGHLEAIRFSPNGRFLAVAFDILGMSRDIVLVDVVSGKQTLVETTYPGFVRQDMLHFSPDGRWLATIVDVRGLWFWNLKKRRAEMLSLPRGDINAFAFSPDGKRLAVARGEGKIQIWKLPD